MDKNQFEEAIRDMIHTQFADESLEDALEGSTYGLDNGQKDEFVERYGDRARDAATEMYTVLNAHVAFQTHIDELHFLYYGIRNVHTVDEEQTRIADFSKEELNKAGLTEAEYRHVQITLASDDEDNYDVAYEYALKCVLNHILQCHPDVDLFRCAQVWVEAWVREQDYTEDDPSDPVREYMDLLNAIYNFCFTTGE